MYKNTATISKNSHEMVYEVRNKTLESSIPAMSGEVPQQ